MILYCHNPVDVNVIMNYNTYNHIIYGIPHCNAQPVFLCQDIM